MTILQTSHTDKHAQNGAGMALAHGSQCEVLSLLCEGLPDKLIARRLDLSHHTVRGHVQILYSLLRVSNRMQAVFAARQHGLIN
jgi:DNA-binding NarL/FixJ family response regulator